jgi:hypothetical protein
MAEQSIKGLLDKLWAKTYIDPSVGMMVNDVWEPCWIWVGARTANNYGCVRVGDKVVYTHRITYILEVDADLDPAMVVDHLCAHKGAGRPCRNPKHLEAVTTVENIKRGKSPIGQWLRDKEAAQCA